MDKYEYNLRNEEINALIGSREFQKAVAIADTIDWTKVRSVRTLCKISDLYKINRRYAEAKILLEQALDRCPTGKSIVSSLCELCVKMEDIIGATEYYKMFVQMAPNDYNRYILLYKIYEMEGATLDEKIEVLEELKKKERIEKWCYELAYLYHKIGLTTRCVEECDDIILWFREGKFVKKAMELKMLHQQLTQSQDALYQNMLSPKERATYIKQNSADEEEVVVKNESEDILVKTVDVGQYSTINIQKALEESIKDTLGENPQFNSGDLVETAEDSTVFLGDNENLSGVENNTEEINNQSAIESLLAPLMQDTGEMQELFFETEVKEEEISNINDETDEISEDTADTYYEADNTEPIEDIGEVEELEEIEEEVVSEEKDTSDIRDQIPFPDMPVSEDTIIYNKGDITNQVRNAVFGSNESEETEDDSKINLKYASKEELMELIDKKVAEALEHAITSQVVSRVREKETVSKDSISSVTPPRSMQRMLSQDYDGQISLVIPEQEKVDKQITGQINIEEYLSNWEDTKRQRQEQTKQQIQNVLSKETGALFTEFEAQARDSILEKIESEADSNKIIDPDKEYEEYINSIMESDKEGEDEEKESEEQFSLNIPDADVVEDFEGLTEIEENNNESVDEIEADVSQDNDVRETEEEVGPEKDKETTEEEVQVSESKPEHKEDEKKEAKAEKEEDGEGRSLTEEELNLFARFVQTKRAKQNLSKALDTISLASYTGNVYVTGDAGEGAVDLARNVVQYVKTTDNNFSGKIGKVSGSSLNGKDVAATVERMKNGGLIIEKAGDMNADTIKALIKVLNQDNLGILVVMQDTKKVKNRIFGHFDAIRQIFNVHIEIEELSDDALVAYGRQYADHMEYSIDEMGILALHTRIDELQTSDHSVTVEDVRDIVDEAIEHATRFSPKHITDIILGRRYDDEDMIILKERDFTN